MANLTTEYFGGGNTTWLGSLHGLNASRTAVLKKSLFTQATHYPDGYIPSGMPLTKTADGTYGPCGANDVLAGFLATDKKVGVDPQIPAALMDHGRVDVANLPVAFTVPAAAKNATTITFV